MAYQLKLEPLTREAFAPFGEVIEKAGSHHYPINAGSCERHHDLARVEIGGEQGRALVNLFSVARAVRLPLEVRLVERHPLGSQAFIPLSDNPFLVVVSRETDEGPGEPIAFKTTPGQGVNIARNVWHGILTPLDDVSDFAVVDRGGEGVNLEEHFFKEPFLIV